MNQTQESKNYLLRGKIYLTLLLSYTIFFPPLKLVTRYGFKSNSVK